MIIKIPVTLTFFTFSLSRMPLKEPVDIEITDLRFLLD